MDNFNQWTKILNALNMFEKWNSQNFFTHSHYYFAQLNIDYIVIYKLKILNSTQILLKGF